MLGDDFLPAAIVALSAGVVGAAANVGSAFIAADAAKYVTRQNLKAQVAIEMANERAAHVAEEHATLRTQIQTKAATSVSGGALVVTLLLGTLYLATR